MIPTTTASAQNPRRARRDLTGPVVADLAAETSPGIAQSDARWAAAYLAGQATTADELRDVLQMVGLLAAPPSWMSAEMDRATAAAAADFEANRARVNSGDAFRSRAPSAYRRKSGPKGAR